MILRFYFLLLAVCLASVIHAQEDDLSIVRFDGIPTNVTVYDIDVDPANHKWVCTNDGLYQIGVNDQVTHYLDNMTVSSVAYTSKGIFASTTNSLYSLDGQKVIKLPKADATINGMDADGKQVYIATDMGLFILQMETEQFVHKTTRNAKLGSNQINFVNVDETGVIWLGTASGEIRIKGKKWKNYHKGYNVVDHFENKEGIWFIGEEDMWLIDYYNREYDAGLDKGLYRGVLNDFSIDTKGRLYFASEDLIRYNPYDDKIVNYSADASIISKSCSAIAVDVKDEVWIGTSGAGMYRLGVGKEDNAELKAAILVEKPILCAGQNSANLKVSVSGGKPPYQYQWKDTRLNGDNPQSVGQGMYALTITDAANNRFMTSIELQEPEAISIDLVSSKRISKPGGSDGSLEVSARGGTGQLKYMWQSGGKSALKSRLGAGEYTVTVTDENKCSQEATFEVLKEKFIPELDIASIKVGQTLRINQLNFKADSSVVTTESYDVLEEVLSFLKQNDNVVVEIGGHTNTIPSEDYCLRLSTDRARNIAEYFYEQGIDEKRLSYKGYGKSKPLTSSRSRAGQQKNQRVEIKIIEM